MDPQAECLRISLIKVLIAAGWTSCDNLSPELASEMASRYIQYLQCGDVPIPFQLYYWMRISFRKKYRGSQDDGVHFMPETHSCVCLLYTSPSPRD